MNWWQGSLGWCGQGRAGLERCKSRSARSLQEELGTFSVCTCRAWERSVDSLHINDKGEQSFLPRHRVIKLRSQAAAMCTDAEGRKLLLQRGPAVRGNKLVTVPPPRLAHGGCWLGAWPLALGHRLGRRCTGLQIQPARHSLSIAPHANSTAVSLSLSWRAACSVERSFLSTWSTVPYF